MADYNKPLKFGYFLIAGRPLIAAAQVAEGRGLDHVAIQDDLYRCRAGAR